jgi:hypothetical protein
MDAVLIRRDEAIQRAGQSMALARAERDQLAAEQGPEAVAEAAWRTGGPAKAEIAATYAGWQAEERGRPAPTTRRGIAVRRRLVPAITEAEAAGRGAEPCAG